MKALSQFLKSARLPVIPEVAEALIPTLAQDYVELPYLRDLIAKDPGLTATVVRWANSPLTGLSRNVNTLDGAISILGISKIRAQAIAVSISNAFELPAPIERNKFWNRSLRCASMSMWLALAIGLDESEAWLTGMLLHLGGVLIYQYDTSLSTKIAAHDQNCPGRWDAQKQLCGFTEGEVMAEAARQWHFSGNIVSALKYVSDPLVTGKSSTLAAVLHLSALLSELEQVGPNELNALPIDVVTRLGIDLAWLSQYLPEPVSTMITP